MSFGGFSGGGFGSNNTQQQQSTGFGGFGSTNNNTTTGFGSSTSGFGNSTNNTTGGGLFGGSNNSTSTGFGSGGFGQNNQTSAFGSRPSGFGTSTTSGGSLFGGGGGTATSSGFGTGGGFGSTTTTTANNNQTTGGFGSSTGGGLFGQSTTTNQSTGFGTSAQGGGPGGGLFSNSGTSTGFGNANTGTSGFGSSNPTFGSSQTTQNTGTGNTPFQVHTEKDQGTNATSQYQSLTFQQPYQNFSFEELRVVDYQQGRKYGNGSGQAGAFGAPNFGSGFGTNTNTATQNSTGFGNTSGGLFGQQTQQNATAGFGQSNSSGFGSSTTGGGLFGQQNKPAGGGLFGNAASTSGQTSGGLFGTASANNNSFGGSGGFGSGTTSGGLFGQNNQTQAPKSLFGAAPNTGSTFGNSTGSTFGQNQSAGGGLFGNNNNTQQGSSLFGQQNQTQSTSGFGSGFGQTQQNNQTQGGGFLGSGFGNNQQTQKPGGLFGSGGGGLFGNTNQQQQPAGGSLFGNSQQPPGGLFAPKPAAPAGGGLFGNQQNNSGGLLGANNQNQQTQGSGLFGQNQNQQPKSLFGTMNNNSGGLFGSQNQNSSQQQQGGLGLFGNSQNNQPLMGNGLFPNSQQNQQPQQPQQLTASIMSTTPYGNEHLFASLGTPQQAAGPVATPLSSGQRARRPAPLPQYKINPAASTRLITPQKQNGYGFSYSTYGTPGSAFSSPSPYGGSLLGTGSLGKSMGRSYSANNLRGAYNSQESIFNANAFSASPMRQGGSGSLKKLHINRNLRTDLFGDNSAENARSSPLKKKVSFDDAKAIEDAPDRNGETSTALVRVEDDDTNEQSPVQQSSTSGQSPNVHGTSASATPEMEQVKGNELAIVPEEGPPSNAPPSKRLSSFVSDRESQNDKTPGEYWIQPTLAELRKKSPKEKKHVRGLVIGRENIGKIEFGECDITNIDLSSLQKGFLEFVSLTHRSASVYLDNINKPAVGKGLNVPSTVTLQNSWPRAKGGKLPVHERKGPRYEKHIKRLKEVEGTQFIEYKPETGEWIFKVQHFSAYTLDYSEHEDADDIESAGFDMPPGSGISLNASAGWQSRSLPGAFDGDMAIADFEMDDEFINDEFVDDPFLDEAAADVARVDDDLDTFHANGQFDDMEEDLTNSEIGGIPNLDGAGDPRQPKSILKPARRAFPTPATPPPAVASVSDDWASQLQRTVSPKKQDRRALRGSQEVMTTGNNPNSAIPSSLSKSTNPFATSMDVMNSLFAQDEESGRKQSAGRKGFQWPYAKRTKLSPTSKAPTSKSSKYETPLALEKVPPTLKRQRELTTISLQDSVPLATLSIDFSLEDFASSTIDDTPAAKHEKTMWQLANILFSLPSDCEDDESFERQRRERLDDFWGNAVHQSSLDHVRTVHCEEEKAIAHLSGHDLWSATEALTKGGNYRLASMVSQIGGVQDTRQRMKDQIAEWDRNNVLSEFSTPIRTLYELLAGNTCEVHGKSGQGPENRLESFNISERFGFDWCRAFGLRLWYGILPNETIDSAVAQYGQDVYEGKESVQPTAWFLNQNQHTNTEGREDILWGLLKLYAINQPIPEDRDVNLGDNLTLDEIISPQNLSLDANDFRLPFQLYHSLIAHQASATDDNLESWADGIAENLVSQIGGASENLIDAVFVAVHLSDPLAREQAVRSLLDRHAPSLGDDPNTCQTFASLKEELLIPESWIWTSKAAYARSVGDDFTQAKCLMRAGDLREAHTVFKRYVAPRAVIEEDLGSLKELLRDFERTNAPEMPEWTKGGAIYADFVQLLEISETDLAGKKPQLLKRLASALPRVSGKDVALEERVAISEMKRIVNKGIDELEKRPNGPKIKESYIPSPRNEVLAEASQLSKEFYARSVEV